MFTFRRTCQAVFQSGFPTLHFYPQSMSFSCSTSLSDFFQFFTVFFKFSPSNGCVGILHCGGTEFHWWVIMYYLFICSFPLMKCLLKYFFFFTGLSVYCWTLMNWLICSVFFHIFLHTIPCFSLCVAWKKHNKTQVNIYYLYIFIIY